MKRTVCSMLVILIIFSCLVFNDDFEFDTKAAETSSIDYGLVDNVQYGQILHCWNWSFDNIKKNMQLIASQGFTAIQTSPIQSSKESTRESWSSVQNSAWVFYQPISFNIEQNSWNALGTKSQFKAMCEEAHKYGIKVIVDTVFNHIANDSTENTINPQITSDLRNDSGCWYSVTWNTSNWEDRYDVTHNCLSGFPDLNTSNTKVQNYAIGFLKECIDAGADGFRFDAAKHIETPADADGTRSDFWPNVLGTATYHAQQTRGITPYYYGELLGSPGGGLSVTAYTDHMSVTDSSTGNNIRNAIASGNASGACIANISNGAHPLKTVQWNESHDTYYADNDSIWISNENMKKTWAIVGSRAEVCGLYLARPENNTTTMLGDGDITAWADKEVKAINRFKNYFAGHPEYLASSGNIVYNERGNTGVVLVNASGGSTSVSVPAHRMYDGVYTDAITGNHFSVSNGIISGNIGSSGIAVVYSYPSTVSASKASQAFRTTTLDIELTYTEAVGGTYRIDDNYSKDFKTGDVVSVGCGVEYGENTQMLITASGGTTTDSIIRTYKKLHPDTQLKMYFDNGSKNWSKVYAYVYNDDGGENKSWPGIEMKYDSSLDLYEYDVPNGFETSKVVFNNGSGEQTPSSGGHAFNAYTSIYKNGYFYGYNTGVSDLLYFKPSEYWKSDNARFAVYVWNTSDNEWVDFTDSDSDGIYEANLPSGVWNECIFARMDPDTSSNNWDNIWNKTGDMGISNNHNYFKIYDGWDTSQGAWSRIDKSIVGKESEFKLVGTFNGWDKTKNPFVYTDDKKAITTVDLSEGTYTFKLINNGQWFGNPGVINDTTDGNGWRMCKNDLEECTLNASGGTYTFVLNTETLKVTVSYEEKEVVVPTQTQTVAPSVVGTENVTTHTPTTESTSVPTTSVIPAGYYLVGSLNGVNCWDETFLSKDRMLTSNPNNVGEYMLNYKFYLGDEVKIVYYDGTEITRWYNSEGDNYGIGSSKVGNCNVYFRPEGNSAWSYNYFTIIPVTVIETDAPTVASTQAQTQASTLEPTEVQNKAGYYIVGTLNGEDLWKKETISQERLLVANPNNQGEYMLEYTFTEGDEVKVVYYDGSEIKKWFNSDGDNYAIGFSKAGRCNVYFRPEGNTDWSYLFFTIIPKSIDETELPTEAPTEAPAPIKVENLTYNVASTNIEFTWDAVPGGVKYWVNKYNEETGTWSSAASSRTTTALVKKLTPDTTYQFKMTCLLENGKMLTLDNADLYEVTTKKAATTTEITGVAEAIQVTLTWEPVEGATKYWVYKAKSEEGPYYIYNSSRTNSLLVKKLDPETDYYFKVTALTVENGISTISEVEYSPVCHTKTISGDSITTRATNVTSNSVKIDWTPYAGADKYWVWISETTSDTTKKDTDWTVVKSITDTSINEYTFSNLENGKTYFVTISARYYQADGTMMVIEYFPAQIMTKYSESDMLTFESVDDTTLKVSWDESIDVQKAWLFVYDENGNHLMNPSSTTNTVTIKNLAGMKNYTYHLRVLDNNGFYGYLTADSGEKYHE